MSTNDLDQKDSTEIIWIRHVVNYEGSFVYSEDHYKVVAQRNAEIERLTAANGQLEAHGHEMWSEVKRLRAALKSIAEYTGEGPTTTPWQAIVREMGIEARAALQDETGLKP